MNTNEEDKKLAQMLKQGAHDPGENPWFTRRVLNKLPEKQTHGSWHYQLAGDVARPGLGSHHRARHPL